MWYLLEERPLALTLVNAHHVKIRNRLIHAHTAECQRIQKTLEDAEIKLDSVASDQRRSLTG